MFKKLLSLFLVLIVFLNCLLIEISADEMISPTPYKIELDNGTKVFYMTLQGNENETQLKSGLYYNTPTLENIYFIDFYLDNGDYYNYDFYYYEYNLIFSSDGMSFVCIPWACASIEEETLGSSALIFYNNGKLTEKYTVSQLLKDKDRGQFTVSHIFWEKEDERKFNSETNVLSINALDDSKYDFDLATGSVLKGEIKTTEVSDVVESIPEEENETDFRIFIIVFGIIAILFLIIIFIIKSKSNNNINKG